MSSEIGESAQLLKIRLYNCLIENNDLHVNIYKALLSMINEEFSVETIAKAIKSQIQTVEEYSAILDAKKTQVLTNYNIH